MERPREEPHPVELLSPREQGIHLCRGGNRKHRYGSSRVDFIITQLRYRYPVSSVRRQTDRRTLSNTRVLSVETTEGFYRLRQVKKTFIPEYSWSL